VPVKYIKISVQTQMIFSEKAKRKKDQASSSNNNSYNNKSRRSQSNQQLSRFNALAAIAVRASE